MKRYFYVEIILQLVLNCFKCQNIYLASLCREVCGNEEWWEHTQMLFHRNTNNIHIYIMSNEILFHDSEYHLIPQEYKLHTHIHVISNFIPWLGIPSYSTSKNTLLQTYTNTCCQIKSYSTYRNTILQAYKESEVPNPGITVPKIKT